MCLLTLQFNWLWVEFENCPKFWIISKGWDTIFHFLGRRFLSQKLHPKYHDFRQTPNLNNSPWISIPWDYKKKNHDGSSFLGFISAVLETSQGVDFHDYLFILWCVNFVAELLTLQKHFFGTYRLTGRVGLLLNETKCHLVSFSLLLNQTKWHLVLSSPN